jgi:DNA uptake protein ComE-like DNA-binding protein
LPGVGVQRALALAKARWAEGAGAVFRDLESQPGIGPITARRIAEYLERSAVVLPPLRDSLALE